jgi:O-antigen ligase
LFYLIFGRFEAQGFSDEGRTELLTKSWDALMNSNMIGIGAGNFRATMDNVYKLENTSPHNLFLEVGIQYGLIIFLLFIGMFIRLYSKQKANYRNSSKFITIVSLVMLPLTSTIDSSYILSVSIWLFLASLYIIADKNYNVN